MFDSLFFLGWTQPQFDSWESRTITIELQMLDKLREAAAMLSEGQRLDMRGKAPWVALAKECEALLVPQIAEIDAMEVSDVPPTEGPEFPIWYDTQGREHQEF